MDLKHCPEALQTKPEALQNTNYLSLFFAFCLEDRFFFNPKALSLKPKEQERRSSRILWSIVSKAAERSSIVNIEIFPLSIKQSKSFTTFNKAVSVL